MTYVLVSHLMGPEGAFKCELPMNTFAGSKNMAISYAVSRVLDNYTSFTRKEIEARLSYGSFVSVEGRFVYIEVPKAASTSMKEVLRELTNAGPLPQSVPRQRETRRRMYVHVRENVPLPSLLTFDEVTQRDLLESPDVLRFTVVREPYRRLVSGWRDKVILCEPSRDDVYSAIIGGPPPLDAKRYPSFGEFVSYLETVPAKLWDPHWWRQVDLTFPKAFDFNHIGDATKFDVTLRRLSDHLKLSHFIINNRSNETLMRLTPHFSLDLAIRIQTLYREDFAAFGYDPKSWPRDENEAHTAPDEERIIDELIERNIIISNLYDEIERLRGRDIYYRYISRLTWPGFNRKLQRIFERGARS